MTAHGTEMLRRDVIGSLGLEAYLDKPFEISQIRQIVQTAVAKIQAEETRPPIQSQAKQPITEILAQFRADTAVRCVLILSQSGHVLDVVGDTDSLDLSSISALVAANFMAGIELARLLGNESVFKTSYHEGPNYNIYAHSIDSNFLLAIIFGSESKQGIVRFYTTKLVEDLAPLLTEEMLPSMEALDVEFSQAISVNLDSLFSN
jgi:predicted regulator of Ras-like GTPase activity (Roadblock/LC7/MglB family)